MKQTVALTLASDWLSALYMSYMSNNFRLFHASNVSVLNFQIFCSCIRGQCPQTCFQKERMRYRERRCQLWQHKDQSAVEKDNNKVLCPSLSGSIIIWIIALILSKDAQAPHKELCRLHKPHVEIKGWLKYKISQLWFQLFRYLKKSFQCSENLPMNRISLDRHNNSCCFWNKYMQKYKCKFYVELLLT